jgi:exodeoxyribonuclease V alpha subunit
LLALKSRLSVISGGPGTGKTRAVTRLLLILSEHEARCGRPCDVALLAPTGKAAQRLTESVSRGLSELGISPEASPIPATASTIHRALGSVPRAPTRFRHGVDRPLPHHVIVVDEASMVDLALMTKLVEAVPHDARLVLLGDRDQLASVEAGAIFGDILGSGSHQGHSGELVDLAAQIIGQRPPRALAPLPIADCTVHLSRSRRYVEDSGIGRVAKALRLRDTPAALEALSREPDAQLVEMSADTSELERFVLDGYRSYADASDPPERLARLERFRLLTAHRSGSRGVEALNLLTERVLARHTTLRPTPGTYDGRPILVLDNDYQLELWNGDIGVVGVAPNSGRLVAYFQRADGLRMVPLSRLPAHETVFAMTVHKSQGSEFERVALVLPERPSPVLTRELVYTAITRAKQRVQLFGSRSVLESGLSTEIRRASGLGEALRASPGEETEGVVSP